MLCVWCEGDATERCGVLWHPLCCAFAFDVYTYTVVWFASVCVVSPAPCTRRSVCARIVMCMCVCAEARACGLPSPNIRYDTTHDTTRYTDTDTGNCSPWTWPAFLGLLDIARILYLCTWMSFLRYWDRLFVPKYASKLHAVRLMYISIVGVLFGVSFAYYLVTGECV